jgi:selenoprotein W-related protein
VADVLSVRKLEFFIRSWTLVPSKGGVFEVSINGEKVFSKKALGRHAEPGEIQAIIAAKVDEIRPPDFVLPEDD